MILIIQYYYYSHSCYCFQVYQIVSVIADNTSVSSYTYLASTLSIVGLVGRRELTCPLVSQSNATFLHTPEVFKHRLNRNCIGSVATKSEKQDKNNYLAPRRTSGRASYAPQMPPDTSPASIASRELTERGTLRRLPSFEQFALYALYNPNGTLNPCFHFIFHLLFHLILHYPYITPISYWVSFLVLERATYPQALQFFWTNILTLPRGASAVILGSLRSPS